MRNKKASPKRRDVRWTLPSERLDDRWSLLIIRDMMLRGFRRNSRSPTKGSRRTFWRIAVEIGSFWNPHHRARSIGWAKADLLADSKRNRSWTAPHTNGAWADAHDNSGNQALVRLIYKDQQQFLAAVPPRWAEKTSRSTTN